MHGHLALAAVDLLLESLRGLRKGELEEIAALSDMRSYFANQESSLVDILVEELQYPGNGDRNITHGSSLA